MGVLILVLPNTLSSLPFFFGLVHLALFLEPDFTFLVLFQLSFPLLQLTNLSASPKNKVRLFVCSYIPPYESIMLRTPSARIVTGHT